jgi:general L-amino acid transport system substrate-binding protein
MQLLSVLIVLLGICCSNSTALAGSVLDRVKRRGTVYCGSVQRPGLAELSDPENWTGLNVDICRAIATAVLGSAQAFKYHKYDSKKDFDAIRSQQDDVYFLTGSEIKEQKLAGLILPIAPVFISSYAVMVPSNSFEHHLSDLTGKSICFLIGSSVERTLESYFEVHRQNWLRQAFSEDGEMIDAYNVQHCHAIAEELTTLARIRVSDPGVNHLSSRILPEPLRVFPVFATTGTQDGQWSSIVAWTISTLIGDQQQKRESRWYTQELGTMLVDAPELGLDPQWQNRVLTTVGNYGDIFNRNLGEDSSIKLEQNFNGCLMTPLVE